MHWGPLKYITNRQGTTTHTTRYADFMMSLTATGSTADVMTPNSRAAAGIHSALSAPAAPTPYTHAPTASALNKVPYWCMDVCMHEWAGGRKNKGNSGVNNTDS